MAERLELVWTMGRASMIRMVALIALFLAAIGCAGHQRADVADSTITSKIHLDLAGLDADGLQGPAGGRRAMHYEFCIPELPQYEQAVRAIDPSIVLHRAAPEEWGVGRARSSASETPTKRRIAGF